MKRSVLGIVLPIVMFGFALGAFLSHRALNPVRQIIRTVQSITSTGDLSARVPASAADDELAELGRLFNQMLVKNQSLIRSLPARCTGAPPVSSRAAPSGRSTARKAIALMRPPSWPPDEQA